MNEKSLLERLEKRIENKEELGYFYTHSIRYLETIKKVNKLANGKKLIILDIGCFPYHVGWMLEEMGHTVYGIASEHEPIKNKHIEVVNIEKEKFPYKDNTFDLVLCNEVIEHLPQSPVFALKEIQRVTKVNGYIMITTPNVTRIANRIKFLFGVSVSYPLDVYFEDSGKGNNIYHRHNREYTLSELSSLLLKTGWSVEQKGYIVCYTPFRKRLIADRGFLKFIKFVNYLIVRPISSFQDTLFVIGEKI